MDNFEQKITDAINEKLNDGTVEKLVGQYIEKGISNALSELFSYGGEAKKMIEKKVSEVMVPVIEKHDFNKYVVKMDSVLTEIVNQTCLADNRRILENFADLMKEPETKEIKMSEIFAKYCEHVAKCVDTDELKACCDDGEPYYEPVTARMESESERGGWYTDCNTKVFKFTCEEDENLNCQIKLRKERIDGDWEFAYGDSSVDINSLRYMSGFEVFLMTLKRAWVKIILDKENGYDDDIEPEEKPEWDLR